MTGPKILTAIIGAVFLVQGCTTEQGAPARGKAIFDENCVLCHGAGGAGDGTLAADLPVGPANLTQLSANNGGQFPRDRVMATIFGYPGKYHTGIMPEFGPLLDGPKVSVKTADGVVQTPRALVDLVDYLETLQQP